MLVYAGVAGAITINCDEFVMLSTFAHANE
jgi:hypothetical protein